MVDFALGSDTSGSIRVPASNCGIYSMRPSHGRISTRGLVPLAPSFDTVAWFARSAELLARCGAVLLDEPLPELKLSEIRLVVLQSAFDSLEKQIRDDLLSYGARISSAFGAHTIERQITYDRLSEWASRYRHLQAFEAWREHGDWVTNCRPKFDSLIEQRFKFASTVTREQYEANLPIRTELVEMLKSHLDERSVLCLPPTWNIPPLISATSEELLQNREKNFTRACIATIAGAPQVTIPVPLQSGKKFGLSFLALPGKDTLLLKLATLLF